MSQEPDPLNELTELFREAAAREIAANPAPKSRWRSPRVIPVVLIGLVSAGGLAAATGVVDLGSPTESPEKPGINHPDKTPPDGIAVRAPDPSGASSWGVRLYRSRAGAPCAVAGQIRGTQLGLIEHGVFHPYRGDRSGPCGNLQKRSFFFDIQGAPHRQILVGRARADVVQMRLKLNGKTLLARTGTGGAFIFVLAGDKPGVYSLQALDSGGKTVVD